MLRYITYLRMTKEPVTNFITSPIKVEKNKKLNTDTTENGGDLFIFGKLP